MNFKVGDKVRIRKDSYYFTSQGHHGIGKISEINFSKRLPYGVTFNDGNHNAYSSTDLELVEETKKEKSKTEKQKIEEGAKVYKSSISTRIETDIKREKENITSRQIKIEKYKKELKEPKKKPTEADLKYKCTCVDCQRKRDRKPQDEIDYQKKMILKNQRNLNSHKSILENALSLKSIKKSIERVKKHPSIVGIEYQPDRQRFSIYTKPLRVLSNQQNIGHYIINICINSRDLGHITIHNQVKRVNQFYDHWLVESGHVCFGNWKTGIMKYLKMGQFYLTVDSLIKLLIVPQPIGGFYHTNTWLSLFNDTPSISIPKPTPPAPASTIPVTTASITETQRMIEELREASTIRPRVSRVPAGTIRLTKPEDLPF